MHIQTLMLVYRVIFGFILILDLFFCWQIAVLTMIAFSFLSIFALFIALFVVVGYPVLYGLSIYYSMHYIKHGLLQEAKRISLLPLIPILIFVLGMAGMSIVSRVPAGW